MISKSFAVKKECLEEVQCLIATWAEEVAISVKISTKLAICSDEIVSNVVFYSGATNLEIQCEIDDTGITLTFIDDGTPFDPLTDAKEPDITASLEDREIGGLGIFMVKKMATSIAYERCDNKNSLEIKIAIA